MVYCAYGFIQWYSVFYLVYPHFKKKKKIKINNQNNSGVPKELQWGGGHK